MKIPRPGTAVLIAVLALAVPARAGSGVGEVSFDRAAVQAVLNSALPFELGAGESTELALRVERAESLQFRDGGVEARVLFTLQPIDFHGALIVRYEPYVESIEGVVLLRPVSAVPDLPLPVQLDLAALLPSAPLPRQLGWTIDSVGDTAIRLTCTVQKVKVSDERLTVEFGLRSEGLDAEGVARVGSPRRG